MTKLTTEQRNALPESDFALPGRRYPIHDSNHAKDALARVAQNGSQEERVAVKSAVHDRYPHMAPAHHTIQRSKIAPKAED